MSIEPTNLWLAIIAVATAAQACVVAGAAIVISRRLHRAEATLTAATSELRERVERTTAIVEQAVKDARPMLARASMALDDLTDLADRARRAETEVRTALGRASVGMQMAKAAMTARAWPALGIAKGLAAGLRVVRSRRAARSHRDDAIAVARFVNEGGSHD
jgi:hypothetical protein